MTADPIRVWAPAASNVDVLVSPVTETAGDSERHTMEPAGGGWWSWSPVTDAPLDYSFSLD
ncbi:MAG: hypothetical protein HOP99_07635, partial [Dermatophilaceae bacterium]|nr:hypothetical protein [Dermatophilaceae bacterium]